MSPDLERLIGRAVVDKAFRDELLKDPEGTAEKAGFKLSPEDKKYLNEGVQGLTSEQLDMIALIHW